MSLLGPGYVPTNPDVPVLDDMAELVGGLLDGSEVTVERDLVEAVETLEARQRAILARLAAIEAVPTIASVLKAKP